MNIYTTASQHAAPWSTERLLKPSQDRKACGDIICSSVNKETLSRSTSGSCGYCLTQIKRIIASNQMKMNQTEAGPARLLTWSLSKLMYCNILNGRASWSYFQVLLIPTLTRKRELGTYNITYIQNIQHTSRTLRLFIL